MPRVGDYFNPYRIFIGSFIPNCLMSYPKVSSSAKLLWARLAQYAGREGSCFPSQEELARQLGVSKRTVVNLVNELTAERLIAVKKMGMTEKLQKSSNRYFFLWHKVFEEGLRDRAFVEVVEDQPNSEKVSPLGRPNSEELFTYKGEELFTYKGEENFPIRESHIRESERKKEGAPPLPPAPPPVFFNCDFFSIDKSYHEELQNEYPLIDFEKLFKKLKDTIIDEPKKYTRDGKGKLKYPRRIIRNWCEREIIWREKHGPSREGDDPIDRRARLIFGSGEEHKD